MDIGIGLPNTVLGVRGETITTWAREAEEAGFSTLSTIGRVAYPGFEELTALAVAAAVTERIGLFPNILVAPTRQPVLLAKTAASVDVISGGRLTLGIGVGGRPDDFAAAGRSFEDRGDRLDSDIATWKRVWKGEPAVEGSKPVVPDEARQIPLVFGGTSDASIDRVVKHGVGYTAAGGGPDMTAGVYEQVRTAWKDAGREGSPRLHALVYFAFGDEDKGRANLLDYYEWLGEDIANMIAGSMLSTPDDVAGAKKGFADIGCDELILDPALPDPDQVKRLAEAAL